VTTPKKPRQGRDPLHAAAVLKRTFQRRKDEQSPQFRFVYEGVLRDLGVADADVDAYLAAHLAEVDASLDRASAPADEAPPDRRPPARKRS